MTKDTVLWIDDDAVLARASADGLRLHLREHNIGFRLLTSVNAVSRFLQTAEQPNVIMAIVDLWMVDKETNKQETDAGTRVIRMLRKQFPKCYVLVVSGHLSDNTKEDLECFDDVGIIEKPIPTSELARIIQDRLTEMHLCGVPA